MKAYICGSNFKGQLGVPLRFDDEDEDYIPEFENFPHKFVLIKQGFQHNLGLTSQGLLYTWGNNRYGQLGRHSKNNKTNKEYIKG